MNAIGAAVAGAIIAWGLPGIAHALGPLEVRQVDIADRKATFAQVQSVRETVARARIGGTIAELGVDDGSAVSAGEKIAVITDPKLKLQIAAVDARIKSLESQEQSASTEVDRATALRKQGVASQARLDEARTAYDVIVGNLAATRAERDLVRQQVIEGDVLAPASGRVLKVKVTAGQVIMPGEQIATIATENYLLRIYLPERHARFMKVGDKVLVSDRGMLELADARTEGHVRKIFPELDHGRVVADIEVAGLGNYFVGERTLVWVSAGTRKTIIIPPEYIYRRFGLTYVNRKDAGDTVVQVGQTLAEGIEILSGVRPGDVLLAPPGSGSR